MPPDLERGTLDAKRDAGELEAEIIGLLGVAGIAHRVRPPTSMMAHGLEGTVHLIAVPWRPAPDEVASLTRAGASLDIRDGVRHHLHRRRRRAVAPRTRHRVGGSN